MGLKALLFDVDGTLADTEPQGHLPAYNLAFEEMGLDWHWSADLYRSLLLLPGGRERLYHYLTEHSPQLGEFQSEAEEDPREFANRIHAVKSRHFYERVKRGDVPLRPGIRRLMTEAHEEGLGVGIVTNASAASLGPFLDYSLTEGLRECVDHVVSGEQVERKKPAPDLYDLAVQKFGVEPGECIAIEDSAMGHDAATRAGIPVVVTLNDDTRDHDFPDALLVVEDLSEPEGQLRVIQGDSGGHACVDTGMLRHLLAAT